MRLGRGILAPMSKNAPSDPKNILEAIQPAGGDDLPAVTELFAEVGATGFTAVSNVSGLGHGGFFL